MKATFQLPNRAQPEVVEFVDGNMSLKQALNSLSNPPQGDFSVFLVTGDTQSPVDSALIGTLDLADGDVYQIVPRHTGGSERRAAA